MDLCRQSPHITDTTIIIIIIIIKEKMDMEEEEQEEGAEARARDWGGRGGSRSVGGEESPAAARVWDELAGVEGLQLAAPVGPGAKNVYWVFGVVLGAEVPFDAEVAMKRLHEAGVGSRPFFWPMHRQPVFERMGLFGGVTCPVAERIGERGFYLPSGAALTDAQAKRSAAALREILA
jgi:hypothetical protein